MKVEIWSDIMCPFCYIGHRSFQAALKQLPEPSAVKVEWKSYQLMPDLNVEPGVSMTEFLSSEKGWSPSQVEQMHARVAQMGAEVGISFNFDQVIPANTLKAHQLLHLAQLEGKQNEAAEVLFRSYFVDGKNIADTQTLLALGEEVGLDSTALSQALATDALNERVQSDIYEAQQIGVRGVPFFLINGEKAISGAQPTEVFQQALL